jgi:hypothetical protein
MYVSKNHPDYERLTAPRTPAAAPEPDGEILARFPRKNIGGPAQELRVVLDHYEGHAYLAVRVWQEGDGGVWWPVKGKGVSIRLSECEGMAEALLRARAATQDDARRPAGPMDPPRPPKRPAPRQGPSRDVASSRGIDGQTWAPDPDQNGAEWL